MSSPGSNPTVVPDGLLAAILDGTSLTIHVKDVQGRYLYVNREFARLAHAPPEVILGHVDPELFPPEVASLFADQDRRVIAHDGPIEFEETIPLPDGLFTFITAKFPIRDASGAVLAVAGVCTDITTREQRTDETMAAERERLAATLRSIGEGVVGCDNEGRITFLNGAAVLLCSRRPAEAIGQPVAEVLGAEPGAGEPVRDLVERLLAGARTLAPLEPIALRAPDGQARLVSIGGAPIRDRSGRRVGAVLSLRDVTERVRLEERLEHARRLEAIGQLAGGIAHDFNNILAGILGHLDLAQRRLEDPEGARRHLAAAERSARQARELTGQLLTFAKGGAPVRQPCAVPSLLEECAAAVLDGSGVRMVMTVEPDLPFVLGDRSQLAQVIQNLLVNARQAMPGGGTVHVRAARAGDGDPGEAPGIALVIEDEGPGVPPEIAARVFDPYFTTRRGGNGMGLAIAQSVVVRHGGRIALGPPGDRGARFVLHLPGTHERPPDPEALAPVAPPPAGRVLILDDDETVLEVTADLMAALGFEPHLAREGREAIATFLAARDQGRPFCLAILDLTVPGGLGGRETLAGLRGIDPAVRAIVSSGYSDDPVLADFRAYGFAAAARKPFTLDELRARVAEALGVF